MIEPKNFRRPKGTVKHRWIGVGVALVLSAFAAISLAMGSPTLRSRAVRAGTRYPLRSRSGCRSWLQTNRLYQHRRLHRLAKEHQWTRHSHR